MTPTDWVPQVWRDMDTTLAAAPLGDHRTAMVLGRAGRPAVPAVGGGAAGLPGRDHRHDLALTRRHCPELMLPPLSVGRIRPCSTNIRFVEEPMQQFASLVLVDTRVGIPALYPQLIVQRLADDLENRLFC